jgi:alpha-glucosidase (family GH31 glycosyl hydrolase)
LKYQWLIGSEIMVVPVVDEGDNDVNAYLPAGEWVHVWTGDIYASEPNGRWYENVPAPMGQPGVFYKQGSPVGETFASNLRTEGLISWE